MGNSICFTFCHSEQCDEISWILLLSTLNMNHPFVHHICIVIPYLPASHMQLSWLSDLPSQHCNACVQIILLLLTKVPKCKSSDTGNSEILKPSRKVLPLSGKMYVQEKNIAFSVTIQNFRPPLGLLERGPCQRAGYLIGLFQGSYQLAHSACLPHSGDAAAPWTTL